MAASGFRTYYVYITTNKNKTVLYTGITNDLRRRLWEHEQNTHVLHTKTFTGKYNAYYLIYFEEFGQVTDAIAREKEIKGWRREKKVALINKLNPEWRFLNDEV
jgi:putative endonuclease